MPPPPHLFRRIDAGKVQTISDSERSLQTFPPERYTDLVRRRGGIISVPRNLIPHLSPRLPAAERLTKLLLNVVIDRSLGPVQVVVLPENSVRDLIKAAIEIYVNEKMRPLLMETDPKFFDLHYSQFSLDSLRPEEKLMNLGSRNFFMCSKPIRSVNSSCSEEEKMATKAPFPWTKFMDFLL